MSTLPATARGRQSRSAIVDAAAQLMHQRGVAGTSLDEVLAVSHAGKSQLYHYFADKQDLVRAVIDRQLDNVLASQPDLHTLQTWRDVERWAAGLLARHETAQGPLACRLGRFAGELDDDEELRGHLVAAFAVWQGELRRGLERLRDRGELRADADPARLAGAALAAVQGGLLLARLQRDPQPLRDAVAMAVAHLRAFRPTVYRAVRTEEEPAS